VMSVFKREDPYQDCVCDDCGRCGAEAGWPCINPITGKPAHCPCVVRVRPEVSA
jgi:hypothetical protein